MKKELQKKLGKYGFLAAAIVGGNDVEAAVIYTDEVPDFAGGIGSQYFLDLNNDAIDDFQIWHNGSSNLYISPLAATNDVLGSGGATFAYPFTLNSAAVISAGQATWFNNGFAGGFQSLNYGSCSFGNWCSVTDKYIGLRFDIAGSIHYGWVRLDVNAAGSVWAVKDYAYEANAGAAISAGDMGTGGSPAASASGIVGTDIADNANGLDLQVDFVAAPIEASVMEYRIIAVKSGQPFTQLDAEAALPANYTSVLPTGSPSYTVVLTAIAQDSDGDPIVNGQPYKIYILNMADGVVATLNSLAVSATDVTLQAIAASATSIIGSDVADNANGTDLQVDFAAPASETGISEYHVIAVKAASAATFNLIAAQGLAPTMYTSVIPTGGPYSFILNGASTDSDGDAIVLGQPYTIFVHSLADGVLSTIDNMASSVSDVTLNTVADAVPAIVGSDIGNNGNGTDLQVNYSAAADESRILAYRIIAVKSAAAGAFTLNDGLALPSTAWMVVAPTGSPNSVVFNSFTTDSDGDPIVNNQPYTIFVLSFANTVTANISNMSSSALDITLMDETGIDENILNDISAFNNGEEIVIEMPVELVETKVNVSLVTMQGQLVSESDVTNTMTTVKTDGIVSGIYFVRFINENGSVRTIKMHL